uniref:Putative lectin/glucanase superfamily protein n=1 Tax=viral metagenome TaxID=1070528 RepID=A0A6M3JJ82_9ZZZZ
MKKIFLFIFISLITLTGFGQSHFKRGAKIGNTDSTAVIDSISKYGDIFRVYSGATRIYDDLLLTTATPLNDIAPVWADTTNAPGGIMTYNQAQNLLGGGGTTAKYSWIPFITGVTTGAPVAGDSSFTHSNFIGKHITAIREGGIQQQHPDNTQTDGFWFNNTNGELRFKPVFGAKEQFEIWATNTIQWEQLSIEGQGSALLTNLRAYWALDEVSGNIVYDALGIYNGTTNAYTNYPGVFGVCEKFQADYGHYIDFGTTVGDIGTSDFTLAAWIKPQQLGIDQGIAGNWGDYPYFYMQVNTENKLRAVINFTGTVIGVLSPASTISQTWIHVALVADRDSHMKIYLNGIVQADTEDISAHSAVNVVNNSTFAVGRIGDYLAGYNFTGFIDEVALYLRTLSAAELLELMTKTYPFN